MTLVLKRDLYGERHKPRDLRARSTRLNFKQGRHCLRLDSRQAGLGLDSDSRKRGLVATLYLNKQVSIFILLLIGNQIILLLAIYDECWADDNRSVHSCAHASTNWAKFFRSLRIVSALESARGLDDFFESARGLDSRRGHYLWFNTPTGYQRI